MYDRPIWADNIGQLRYCLELQEVASKTCFFFFKKKAFSTHFQSLCVICQLLVAVFKFLPVRCSEYTSTECSRLTQITVNLAQLQPLLLSIRCQSFDLTIMIMLLAFIQIQGCRQVVLQQPQGVMWTFTTTQANHIMSDIWLKLGDAERKNMFTKNILSYFVLVFTFW